MINCKSASTLQSFILNDGVIWCIKDCMFGHEECITNAKLPWCKSLTHSHERSHVITTDHGSIVVASTPSMVGVIEVEVLEFLVHGLPTLL